MQGSLSACVFARVHVHECVIYVYVQVQLFLRVIVYACHMSPCMCVFLHACGCRNELSA